MSKYTDAQKATLEEILKPLAASAEEQDFYTKNLSPDTSNFLRAMAEEAVSVQFVEFYDDERSDKFDKIFGGAEDECWKYDNTYNYNEAWSDVMCVAIQIVKDESAAYTVAFAPHYGGDVRGNYGDYVVLTFASMYDYYEAVDQFLLSVAYEFELDGRSFECRYTGSGEYFYLEELGSSRGVWSDGFVPEPWDEEDFLKSARKEIEACDKAEAEIQKRLAEMKAKEAAESEAK